MEFQHLQGEPSFPHILHTRSPKQSRPVIPLYILSPSPGVNISLEGSDNADFNVGKSANHAWWDRPTLQTKYKVSKATSVIKEEIVWLTGSPSNNFEHPGETKNLAELNSTIGHPTSLNRGGRLKLGLGILKDVILARMQRLDQASPIPDQTSPSTQAGPQDQKSKCLPLNKLLIQPEFLHLIKTGTLTNLNGFWSKVEPPATLPDTICSNDNSRTSCPLEYGDLEYNEFVNQLHLLYQKLYLMQIHNPIPSSTPQDFEDEAETLEDMEQFFRLELLHQLVTCIYLNLSLTDNIQQCQLQNNQSWSFKLGWNRLRGLILQNSEYWDTRFPYLLGLSQLIAGGNGSSGSDNRPITLGLKDNNLIISFDSSPFDLASSCVLQFSLPAKVKLLIRLESFNLLTQIPFFDGLMSFNPATHYELGPPIQPISLIIGLSYLYGGHQLPTGLPLAYYTSGLRLADYLGYRSLLLACEKMITATTHYFECNCDECFEHITHIISKTHPQPNPEANNMSKSLSGMQLFDASCKGLIRMAKKFWKKQKFSKLPPIAHEKIYSILTTSHAEIDTLAWAIPLRHQLVFLGLPVFQPTTDLLTRIIEQQLGALHTQLPTRLSQYDPPLKELMLGPVGMVWEEIVRFFKENQPAHPQLVLATWLEVFRLLRDTSSDDMERDDMERDSDVKESEDEKVEEKRFAGNRVALDYLSWLGDYIRCHQLKLVFSGYFKELTDDDLQLITSELGLSLTEQWSVGSKSYNQDFKANTKILSVPERRHLAKLNKNTQFTPFLPSRPGMNRPPKVKPMASASLSSARSSK